MKKKKNNPNFEEQLQIEKLNMKLITKEIPSNDYEKIFPKTKNFDQNSIIDFVSSLCEIAKKQFIKDEVTKIFFLQKVVEVAESNVRRNRYIWRNIWKTIGAFLTEVGLDEKTDNSITSIDSLRQLAMIYLPKEENSEFHFQTEFLKPFKEIWEKTNNEHTKEYIIFCINNIVRNQTHCIKSGWHIILEIYSSAINEDNINNNNEIAKQIFDTLYDISINHFTDIKDILPNFIQCVGKYSLIKPKEVNNILNNFKMKINKIENFQTLLSSYSPFISYENEEIRSLGLNNLFITLNYGLSNLKGLKENSDFWKFFITTVLIPIIEELDKKSMKMSDKELENSTFLQILSDIEVKTANLFNSYFEYNYIYFNNFLFTLSEVILEENKLVCYTGLECLKYMIGSDRMSNSIYLDLFIKLITSLIHKSLQTEFFSHFINS